MKEEKKIMTKLLAMKMMPVDSLNLCENVDHVY